MTPGKHPLTYPLRALIDTYTPKTPAEAEDMVECGLVYAKNLAAIVSCYTGCCREAGEEGALEVLQWALPLLEDLLVLTESAWYSRPLQAPTHMEMPHA